MCGINGYIQFRELLDEAGITKIVGLMNDKIIHRGPDEDGLFVNKNVGLGMRRLSIIDLKTGKQPIFNNDKSLVIVLNGEIYNYKELRKQLIGKGLGFNTTSDTEVVLKCFEVFGTASFNMLKGMFAFAIHDLRNQKTYIVRDRAGEKPLYYYKDEEMLLFASELKSMIATKMVEKQISTMALYQYLQLTYIPAPLSIFESVFKLLAGHYMEICNDGTLNTHKYWDVSYSDSELINDFGACKKKLWETMFLAVGENMEADVPIGAFLSGGIDSTIVTGIMARLSENPINTFTIGFKEKRFDESKRAALTAKMHNTNHHIHFLTQNDFLSEIDSILENIDEPFADSSLIPTYMVSKFAANHVKTVLTGDAGDELFGGYNKYLIGHYGQKYLQVPTWLRKGVFEKLVYALPDKSSISRKTRKVIENAEKSVFEQRKSLMCLGFKHKELDLLLERQSCASDALEIVAEYYNLQQTKNELSKALYLDFKIVLEGDMLAKVDRASMLNSLETRTPMLHKDVIELAAKIPPKFKINANATKIILKETFSSLIPKELLGASKKGFAVPIGSWFRKELKADLTTTLAAKKLESHGMFNQSYVQQVLQQHFSGKQDRSSELWSLFVFQKWYDKVF